MSKVFGFWLCLYFRCLDKQQQYDDYYSCTHRVSTIRFTYSSPTTEYLYLSFSEPHHTLTTGRLAWKGTKKIRHILDQAEVT